MSGLIFSVSVRILYRKSFKIVWSIKIFIAEFFEENFESRENNAQILKNVNRHIYLCKQLNKTTFSLWLLSIRI
jgi:hypothetical protein